MKNILLAVMMLLISPFMDESNTYDERESTILYTLMGITDYLHYSPKNIDDKLSMAIYDDYIEVMDGAKRFILQSEIDQLSVYKKDIDNQIQAFDFEFFDKSEQLLLSSIKRAESIYKSVIEKEFSIDSPGMYDTEGKNKSFPTSEKELEEEWTRFIQYTVIGKMYDYDDGNLSKDELKEKAIAKTEELYNDWFSRMSKITRADRFDRYVNTIMTQFDPHSSYFSPKEQENFEIQMGNKLEGIGAQLSPDGDFVKVVSIVPGGPAWKGEELQEEDIIIEVQQLGEEPVDITGMRLDDVIRMIRGDKGTTVLLKVKRAGGISQKIQIVRDEIILEDALAKSAILEVDKQIKNIGYIHLPLFYGTFEGGKSCAEDVEKEIEELKNEGVEGIILDLRYNRGGSLPDAIDMTGLFIEKGPVVQVSDNKGNAEVYKDENPHVSYDGPLIVLVNSVSASSSEIVAGALQDYKRAVIVGGPKTYGKGTVQGLFDLDRMIQDNDAIKPLGQVKLTVQKFYRISGKSNQLKGIIPDVIIPDEFYNYDYGENEYEDALSYSEIKPLKYKQDVYTSKNLKELMSKSTTRTSGDNKFSKVKEYSQLLVNQENDTKVYLDYEEYEKDIDLMADKMKSLKDVFSESAGDVFVKNTEEDQVYIDEFDSRKQKNIRFLESLMNDIQLRESLLIMKDMIAEDKRLAQK